MTWRPSVLSRKVGAAAAGVMKITEGVAATITLLLQPQPQPLPAAAVRG